MPRITRHAGLHDPVCRKPASFADLQAVAEKNYNDKLTAFFANGLTARAHRNSK